MKTPTPSIEHIERCLQQYGKTLEEFCLEYGEPGYAIDAGKQAILFADWNDIPDRIMTVLERHYAIEWSDEWIISDIGKAYRTSPDSYFWKPYYVILDLDIVGGDEIQEDINLQRQVIEEYLNNPQRCIPIDIDLEKHGFEYNGTFENGLYDGMNDDPEKLLAFWQDKRPEYDYIFSGLEASQFYISFELYSRPKDYKYEEQ